MTKDPYVQVVDFEYDEDWTGGELDSEEGNYEGEGVIVQIPVSLIEEADEKTAFEQYTGRHRSHIIHYDNEESEVRVTQPVLDQIQRSFQRDWEDHRKHCPTCFVWDAMPREMTTEERREAKIYEFEVMNAGLTDDQQDRELGRLYPSIGKPNGHPFDCPCFQCTPDPEPELTEQELLAGQLHEAREQIKAFKTCLITTSKTLSIFFSKANPMMRREMKRLASEAAYLTGDYTLEEVIKKWEDTHGILAEQEADLIDEAEQPF